jgi:hypothetical protein
MQAGVDVDPLVQDLKILGKLNTIQRTTFMEKAPQQMEHILRLISERLHLGLDKRDGVRVQDPNTWLLTAEEIQQLSHAMFLVNEIRISMTPHDRS